MRGATDTGRSTPSLLDVVHIDHRRAASAAAEVLEVGGPPAELAVAHRALAIAERMEGRLDASAEAARTAMAVARDAGLTADAALAASTLALTVGYQGDWTAALALVDDCLTDLPRARQGRPLAAKGLVLQRLGRNRESVECYADAVAALREAGDTIGLTTTMSNLGVAYVEVGRFDRGQATLAEACALAESVGATRAHCIAMGNLGYVAGVRGDLVTALSALQEAERLFADSGAEQGLLLSLTLDRAGVLLRAGLRAEAGRLAESLVPRIQATVPHPDQDEFVLRAARIMLAGGRHGAVRSVLRPIHARLAEGEREAWSMHASFLLATAGDHELGVDAASLADRLRELGWPLEAGELLLGEADLRRERGEVEAAVVLLQRVDARSEDEEDALPWPALVQRCVAASRLATLRGDQDQVAAAARTALQDLAGQMRHLRSLEIRASLRSHVRELVTGWVDVALARSDPWEVLAAVDGMAALEGARVPVRAEGPPELTEALAELRGLHDEQRQRLIDDPAAAAALHARIARVEERVRALDRGLPGEATRIVLDPDAVHRASHAADLVHLFVHRGDLHGIVVGDGAIRVRRLGAHDALATATAAIDAEVLRVLRRGRPPGGVARRAVAALQEVLAPLDLVPGRPTVVAGDPAPSLPLGLLEVVRPGGVCTTRSLAGWVGRAAGVPWTPPTSVLLVAGPDLPRADDEVQRLASRWDRVEVVPAARSGSRGVLRALGGVDLAHLCAHGEVNPHNPLLSSIRLGDGPLWAYELSEVAPLPRVMVLASCSVGAEWGAGGGTAALGMGSALLDAGAGTVVAPSLPVQDEAAVAFGDLLHRHLGDGTPPAASVAAALDALDLPEPALFALRAAITVAQ